MHFNLSATYTEGPGPARCRPAIWARPIWSMAGPRVFRWTTTASRKSPISICAAPTAGTTISSSICRWTMLLDTPPPSPWATAPATTPTRRQTRAYMMFWAACGMEACGSILTLQRWLHARTIAIKGILRGMIPRRITPRAVLRSFASPKEAGSRVNARVHRRTSRSLFAQAVGHHQAGRLKEAVACYRQALALKPDLAGAHSNLGTALCELGELEEAETSYRRALDASAGSGGGA